MQRNATLSNATNTDKNTDAGIDIGRPRSWRTVQSDDHHQPDLRSATRPTAQIPDRRARQISRSGKPRFQSLWPRSQERPPVSKLAIPPAFLESPPQALVPLTIPIRAASDCKMTVPKHAKRIAQSKPHPRSAPALLAVTTVPGPMNAAVISKPGPTRKRSLVPQPRRFLGITCRHASTPIRSTAYNAKSR